MRRGLGRAIEQESVETLQRTGTGNARRAAEHAVARSQMPPHPVMGSSSPLPLSAWWQDRAQTKLPLATGYR